MDRMIWRIGLATVSIAFVMAGAAAQETRPDPADDLKTLILPKGFHAELYAADPAVAKPIQMNFDAQGRLWVVSSESYPQLEPGAEPRDKVFVLEDADGDGKAEKSRVFADGLFMPTGIEVGDNGVYVGHSTEVLHLKDTDGDGEADQTRVVLSGFGTEDTHHLVHSFRWGPEGLLHFAQSIYIHSHVETPWGVRRLNGGGFWMYHPLSERLEVLVHGMVNSWGIAFDKYGQSFGVDNDHQESSIKYFLPGARLKHTPNESLILTGIVQQKPKYCGADIVAGKHFPDDWQGDLITCDFRAHRVCRFKISDSGAGYSATEMEAIISSSNPAFRPIDVKFGPDGALYVCDWYNPIINHGEVDFRDPRRDKTHGRIWRVVATDRPLTPRPQLTKASTKELIALQSSPEGWTRHFACRVLAERPRDEVLRALNEWLAGQTDSLLRLRGLWLFHQIDEPNLKLVDELLNDADPGIRAAAVRVLSQWVGRLQVVHYLALLHGRVTDQNPRVRMEAVRALAKANDPDAMESALRAVDLPRDMFLDYAIKLTARETAPDWLPVFKGNDVRDQADARRWSFALLALESSTAAGPLLEIYRRGLTPENDAEPTLRAIGTYGQPGHLRVLIDTATTKEQGNSVARRLAILGALADASRLRGVRPTGDMVAPLRTLLQESDKGIVEQAVRLAGLWRLEGLRDPLTKLATTASAPRTRRAALEALTSLGGPASTELLSRLAADSSNRGQQIEAIGLLATLDANQAAKAASPLLIAAKTGDESAPVFQAILGRKEGPQALAAALSDVTLAAPVATTGIRLAAASGQVAPEFVAALKKAGSLSEAVFELTPQQLNQIAASVMREGDAKRGEEIYKREKLACVKCHRFRGTGGDVGPDLTTIGTSAPVDYLVESVLLPNKKVKENFHSLVVVTASGEIVTGIEVKKTDQELVLRDAENKLISIPAKDIETSKMGGSIMPANVVESINSQEVLDLVRFLSELGKPGPYGPAEEQIARRWNLLGPLAPNDAAAIGTKLVAAGAKPLDGAKNWTPSLTTFDGWVYLREYSLTPNAAALFAVCDIDVAASGKARLALEPAGAAELWLDGKPLKPVQTVGRDMYYDVEFPDGRHALLVRVNLTSQPNFLKLRAFALDEKAKFTLAPGE